MEYAVNQLIKIPFTSTGLATGLTAFAVTVLNNGGVISPALTYTEIGGGLYTLNVTPLVTGSWAIFIQGSIQAKFNVVSKTINSIVSDLSDEALGSWTWNKATGLLTLLRGDATALATYTVIDNLQVASRERLS